MTESDLTKAEQEQAMLERQKKLRPSIIIDISFGVLFFFVAREFGLVTAALTGAAATLVLFAVQPFTKHDLLGGFAVFGVVMSLISAAIAWGFQDDLAVKLRGTFMACIAAAFALYDGFVLKGGYLGERMAMYMEGLGTINPRRASFALAGSTLLLMMIDTQMAGAVRAACYAVACSRNAAFILVSCRANLMKTWRRAYRAQIKTRASGRRAFP